MVGSLLTATVKLPSQSHLIPLYLLLLLRAVAVVCLMRYSWQQQLVCLITFIFTCVSKYARILRLNFFTVELLTTV